MTEPETERHTKEFERAARRSLRLLLLSIPLGVFALVDLATGSTIGTRKTDLALLVAVGMGIWGSLSLNLLARRIRNSQILPEVTPMLVVRMAFSIATTVALTGGIGYLLGGWPGAVLILAAAGILTGFAIAVGVRRGRKRHAAHSDLIT